METKSKAVRVGAIGGLGGVALVGTLLFANPLGASAHDVVALPAYDRTGAALATAEQAYEQKVALERFLEAKLAAAQAEVAQAKAAVAAAEAAAASAPAPATAVRAIADVDPHHCDGDHDAAASFSAASYRGDWGGGERHHRR